MSSAEIARTVKTLFSPGDVIELRTFKDGTYSGYFNDHDKLVKAAVQHDERGHDVYITLNKLPKDLVYRRYNKIERSKPKDASTADKDIDRRNYLFIDADCERVSGISSTDAEKEKSRLKVAEISAHLAAWDWGSPIVCDSGNGYHLLYPIDLPADEDALKLVSGVLESLDFKFSDEAVKVDTTTKDAARITKCYGTVAKKGENQPDRPHRASKILTVPEVLTPVSPQQLEAVAATKPEEPQRKGRGAIGPKAYKDFDMGEWIAEHDIPVKFDAPWQGGHKWILKECLNGHTDNAGYLIQMPSGAKVARCHHNSCTYEWPDYYEHFDPDAYSRNGFRAKGDGNDSNDSDSKGFAGVLADMPEPVEFPTDTMPESVRPFIRETAASIGCPVDFVGLSALVALAAMGDTRRIVIKREWLESATLFGMNIGEPGSKKTPAMNAPFRPVREKQMKYKSEYERQKEEYKSQLVNYQKAVKEGPTELSEPDKPTLRRTYGDDTTVERLADVLNENPRGVVIIKDELSGWLGSMNQYKAGGKGSDRQFWLSVHTNQPVSVDRKSLEEPVIVPRPWASVCGGIQPGVLPDFGKDRGDGLMDRFLPVYPNPPAGSWTDDEVSEEARTAYDETISAIYRLEHAEGDDGPFPSRVNMTDDAKALFIQEYNGLHAEMNDLGFSSRLQPAWSKLEAYFARIALILGVTRHVENPTAHMFEVVAKQDVANAAKLLAYFKNHVRRVYTGLYGDNPDDRLAADIRSFLVTFNKASLEGTASELFDALDSDHKPERPEDLAKVVRGLAKRSSTLTWTDLKRTKHRRPFRLSLRNAVIAVIAVTPEGEEHHNATETLQPAESNGTSDTSGPSPNGKVIASEEEVFELVRSEPLLEDEMEL